MGVAKDAFTNLDDAENGVPKPVPLEELMEMPWQVTISPNVDNGGGEDIYIERRVEGKYAGHLCGQIRDGWILLARLIDVEYAEYCDEAFAEWLPVWNEACKGVQWYEARATDEQKRQYEPRIRALVAKAFEMGKEIAKPCLSFT